MELQDISTPDFKILKGSLDSIPSPSPSVQIQIMGGNVVTHITGCCQQTNEYNKFVNNA